MLDFKVMDISFCGRTTDNVVKAESKKQVLDILEHKYSITIKDKQALILTDRNISVKRPCANKYEIPAKFYYRVLGKKVKKKILANKKIKWTEIN